MKPKMIILRGPPGSGKSVISNMLHELADAQVFSIDHYRMVDGKYVWDPSREKEVIGRYKADLGLQLESDDDRIVVIDNCNSRKWEYKTEAELAEKYGYQVHVLEVQSSFWDCMSRQSHPLPRGKMREIFDRWETPISSAPGERLDGLEMAMHAVLQSQQHVENAVQDIRKAFGDEFNAVIIKNSMKSPAPEGDEAIAEIRKALERGLEPKVGEHAENCKGRECCSMRSPSPEGVVKGHDSFKMAAKDANDKALADGRRPPKVASDEQADVSAAEMFKIEKTLADGRKPRAVIPGMRDRGVVPASEDKWAKKPKPMKMTKKDQETDG